MFRYLLALLGIIAVQTHKIDETQKRAEINLDSEDLKRVNESMKDDAFRETFVANVESMTYDRETGKSKIVVNLK